MKSRCPFLLAALVAIAPGAGGQVSEHHHPVYLVGGFETLATTNLYPRGLFLYDRSGAAPTLRKLTGVPYTMSMQHNVRMDYDNVNLIGFTQGISTTLSPWSGCFVRYDAATNTWIRLLKFPSSGTSSPQAYYYEHGLRPIIDQDGDYLALRYRNERVTTPTTLQRLDLRVMKIDRTSLAVTTLLTSLNLPVKRYSGFSQLGRDIHTGRLMIGGWQDKVPPPGWDFPVWTLDPESGYPLGSLRYWNDGSVHGWPWAGYAFEQNVANGCLEGLGDQVRYVHQLKPGSSGLTTLAAVTGYPNAQIMHGARFDLQTAARPRYLLGGFYYPRGAWLLQFDVKTWALTTFDTVLTTAQYRYPYLYWQDFYRGRHIQTVRTGRDRWTIRLSCPRHPNLSYVLVASLSGLRPGVPIGDGRRINLNPDTITYVTLHGLMPAIWSMGPGRLDARGEARGFLDVSSLWRPANGWGIPVWIAMAVVDPNAPTGLAYLPDTYVMRL